MRQTDFDAIKHTYRYYIDQLDNIAVPKTLDSNCCEILTKVSSHHRRLAIAILLSEADLAAFGQHLRSSGQLRLLLLQMAMRQGVGDFVQWARQGLVGAFFDAWVANAGAMAVEIATLSHPLAHQPKYEYAEDYYYARWWYAVALSDWQPGPAQAEELRALSEATNDDDDPRLQTCRALTDRNVEQFNAAMKALCQQYIDLYKERAVDPGENATEGYVFIEGLALRRLAQSLTMAVDNEYPRVPGIVR